MAAEAAMVALLAAEAQAPLRSTTRRLRATHRSAAGVVTVAQVASAAMVQVARAGLRLACCETRRLPR